MTDKEKLEKIKALADKMYSRMAYLTSDTRPIRQAMDEYHQFIISEYHKEEPVSGKECMYSKDNYTDEDRKVLCGGCEEECKFNKKEDPVSEEQVKESLISKHEDKTCKENGNSLTQEPISDDLEESIDTYLSTYFGGEKEKQEWPFLKKMAIHFANWQKQQMEAYRIEHCKSLTNEQAELEDNFVSSHVEKNNRIPTFIDAIEYGMEYCKQQMMAKAVDAVVKVDAGGYPYIDRTIELYDYDKDIPLAKRGDKYKVILIKED